MTNSSALANVSGGRAACSDTDSVGWLTSSLLRLSLRPWAWLAALFRRPCSSGSCPPSLRLSAGEGYTGASRTAWPCVPAGTPDVGTSPRPVPTTSLRPEVTIPGTGRWSTGPPGTPCLRPWSSGPVSLRIGPSLPLLGDPDPFLGSSVRAECARRPFGRGPVSGPSAESGWPTAGSRCLRCSPPWGPWPRLLSSLSTTSMPVVLDISGCSGSSAVDRSDSRTSQGRPENPSLSQNRCPRPPCCSAKAALHRKAPDLHRLSWRPLSPVLRSGTARHHRSHRVNLLCCYLSALPVSSSVAVSPLQEWSLSPCSCAWSCWARGYSSPLARVNGQRASCHEASYPQRTSVPVKAHLLAAFCPSSWTSCRASSEHPEALPWAFSGASALARSHCHWTPRPPNCQQCRPLVGGHEAPAVPPPRHDPGPAPQTVPTARRSGLWSLWSAANWYGRPWPRTTPHVGSDPYGSRLRAWPTACRSSRSPHTGDRWPFHRAKRHPLLWPSTYSTRQRPQGTSLRSSDRASPLRPSWGLPPGSFLNGMMAADSICAK